MINNIISGAMLIIYGYYFFKDVKKSMILLYIFGMVAPNLSIGDTMVPLYIVIFMEMLFLFVIFRSKWLLSIKFDRKDTILFLMMVYLNLITFVNLILGNIYELNMVAFFSDWRFWFWYVLIRKMDFDSFDNFIAPVLFINFIVVAYQFFFPNSVDIFYQLYTKSSYSVLDSYMQAGYMERPVGTLLSPVVVGAFALITFAFYLKENNVTYRKIKILVAVLLGVMALSKTTMLGIPIILLINMFSKRFNVFTALKLLIAFSIMGGVVYTLIINLPSASIQLEHLNYYFQFMFDPLRALDTRYSSDGNVFYFFDLLKDYLWFGLGSNEINGVNIIDSMYISLLAKGGIILMVVYILWLKNVCRNYLIFIAMILSGFGGSYIFNLMILPFICDCTKKEEIS